MAKQMWKAGNMQYPLPAVMVSCKREGKKPNIITVAWAGTICTNPAMVSISIRKERYSYDIIKDSISLIYLLFEKGDINYVYFGENAVRNDSENKKRPKKCFISPVFLS